LFKYSVTISLKNKNTGILFKIIDFCKM